ncbi:MAG TPA: HAMP domain-containing sensor histidine kinase [Balneolaceae bacterium]|nr:HAMP domain-containing sensor histidine kinase [Balneolaceae bacterium]
MKQIKERDQSKVQLVHELKQPIAIITMLADLAIQNMEEPASQQRDNDINNLLKKIREQGTLCSDILESMNSPQLFKEGEFELTNINSVIAQALENVKIYTDNDDIKFQQELEQNVPSVTINRIGIQQVLTNILTNAVEAMQNCSEKKLTVGSRKTDGGIIIDIADTGDGINEELRDKIFDPYISTKGDSGRGVGLYICKRIIENHDGTINVDSEKNKGTHFQIFLPRHSVPIKQ